MHVEAPLNVFRNQLVIREDKELFIVESPHEEYTRHYITLDKVDKDSLTTTLKERLNPLLINGIKIRENFIQLLQDIYLCHFRYYNIRITQGLVQDVREEERICEIIEEDHKRAHRILRKANFESSSKFDRNWGNRSGQSRSYKPYGPSNQRPNVTEDPTPLVKMEMDRSAQTRRSNYYNQPGSNNPFKRRAGSINEGYSKHQKLYTMESNDKKNPQEPTTYQENVYNEEQENSTQDHQGDAYKGEQSDFMQDGPPAFFI